MTRLDCSELKLVELLGEKQEIPVLELWHWLGQAEVWPDISRSLAAPPALRLEKLVLNDVGLTDQFVPHIIETLVNVRCRPSVIYDHLYELNEGIASWKPSGNHSEKNAAVSGVNFTADYRQKM